MKDQFQYNAAPKPCPVRIEQVFAEKPGGGLVVDPGYDVEETTAVGRNEDGKWAVIKSARLLAKLTAGSITLEVSKGHGFKPGEFLGYGEDARKIIEIEEGDSKDNIKIVSAFSTNYNIEAGECLFQAKESTIIVGDPDQCVPDVSTPKQIEGAIAQPIYTPEYIISVGDPIAHNGIVVPTGHGDVSVRLINGANVRRETACFGRDIEALMPGIKLV